VLDNYVEILTSAEFWLALMRTALYALVCVSVELIIGFILAVLFQVKFLGKRAVRSMTILPLVAMPIAIAYIWRIIFDYRIGVLNYLLNILGIGGLEWTSSPSAALVSVMLVDIWQWTPFMFLILSSGITALPRDCFEAAVIDGANIFQTIRLIMVPLLKSIITIALIFRLVDAFKAFDLVYILTGGGPGNASETLNVHTYLYAFKYLRMGHASALSVLMMIIVIFICNLLIRFGDLRLKE
jgi:multiple sugar transport system permease protein